MHDSIAERRRKRADLLERIYREVNASVTEFVSVFELASSLDIDRDEVDRIVAYLEEKGFVKVDDHRAGILRLTADGVDAVEQEVLRDGA